MHGVYSRFCGLPRPRLKGGPAGMVVVKGGSAGGAA